MALYKIKNDEINQVKVSRFSYEKELQNLCENNLETLFQVKFISSEFAFADEYAGRLDTIGLDFDGNPVIIEYKLDQSPSVLSQSLCYMDWLVNHKGDFEKEAHKKLGNSIDINWDKPKMIIVAQEYNKYDKFAVNRIPYDIYLYKYIKYETGEFYMENINTQDCKKYYFRGDNTAENNVIVSYDKEYYFKKSNCVPVVRELYEAIDEEVLKISESIERRFTKIYTGYRTTRNFLEVQVQKNALQLYVLPADYNDERKIIEDVPETYKYVTNKRFLVSNINDIQYALQLIKTSYEATL